MKPLRHIFLHALLLLAALLALSCQKGVEKEEQKQDGDGVTLTLQLKLAGSPMTKVQVPGDDSRNENVISSVDIFLFSGDGGTGTEVARFLYVSRNLEQDAMDSAVHTLSVHLSNDRAEELFGTVDPGAGNSVTAKIVVVGNGDSENPGGYMIYPSAATSSVQAVRESVAMTNLDGWYVENDLSYLILCGDGTITLTHTVSPDEVKATGTIPMDRSYAKMDIDLRLPTSGRLEVSGRTYELDRDHMQIELHNLAVRGYVGSDASHVRTCTVSDLRSTTTYPFTLTAAGNPLTATHNAFYSYPRRLSDMPDQKLEYRIKIPWRATDAAVGDPVHVGYYSFPVVDEETISVILNNYYYHSEASIHTLGSTDPGNPEELEGTWELLDWKAEPIYGTFNDYKYLVAHPQKVSMPGVTNGIATFLSSSAILKNVGTPKGYEITSIRTYGVDATGAETSRLITAAADTARYTLTLDRAANTISLHHDLELEGGAMYYRQEITVTLRNGDNLEETIVFEQTPAILVQSTGQRGTTDNFFVDGYKTGEGSYLSSTDYLFCMPPDDASTMALVYNLRFSISSFPANGDTYINGDPAANPVVRNKYIIGDTRVYKTDFTTSNFNHTNPGNSSDKTYQWNKDDELDKIMIADSRPGSADWIAPDFITCTGIARAKPLTRDQLEMRAAMYQESGYPAGRWRLMTEAEFKFLVNLQISGKIPTLFYPQDAGQAGSSPYFTAQGSCFEISSDGRSYHACSPMEGGKAYARFVYDSWYWGPDPDPDSVTTYNPQP